MQSPTKASDVIRKQNRYFVILVASVAAIGGVLFGFDTGVISGAILFIAKEFHLSPAMNGLVVSAVLIGAVLGSVISGRVADYFGRRWLLIATAIIFIFGTYISALAPDIFWLVFGRIVVGFAIGISSFVAPLYISEISPVKYRGALVSLNQLAITIGIVVSYLIDYRFSHTGAWRWMLGSGVIPAFLLLVGMIFLPYSPRWMMLKGNSDKAREILRKVRGVDNVEEELMAIRRSVMETHGGWNLLVQKWLLPALIIGFGLAFFQQTTGINTIIYYAPTIFRMAGFHSASAAILATLGVGVVNVLFTIIALPLIDKWGRRPLLLLGLTGMTISLFLLSIAFFQHDAASGMLKWIALGSMVLYIACFAISLGPIMWLIITEVFPLKIRGLGSSIAIASSWGFNMVVALTFLSLIKAISPGGTFLVYACISVFGLLFVYFVIPETKGVSLEQIEENLRAGKGARELGQGS